MFKFIPGVIDTGNLLVAIIIGVSSGLSATGINQTVKQLTKNKYEEDDDYEI